MDHLILTPMRVIVSGRLYETLLNLIPFSFILFFVHNITMGTNANMPEHTAQCPGENSTGPKRILVQTKTNLVPGGDYLGRCEFMLDFICQHHWNRDYDPDQDRWSVYGAQFGYDNRRCYFLVDHGQSATDDDVPVLWYQWTGESVRISLS
jgi:hypothetical protein